MSYSSTSVQSITGPADPAGPNAQQGPGSNTQFGRQIRLFVSNATQALDLSALRVEFKVTQADNETPNSLYARVSNPNPTTVSQVQQEYTKVTLQAGYPGNLAVIFQGTIKQTRAGRRSPTDTYLDIIAADDDIWHNQTIVNTSLAAGSSDQQRLKAIIASGASVGITTGSIPAVAGGTLPRGKVLYGLARDVIGQQASSQGCSWYVLNGQVYVVPRTGYLPGTAVVLTAQTGVVGIPEQTQEGIRVTCLLNPSLKIGGLVQLNNQDIASYTRQLSLNADSLTSDAYATLTRQASLAPNGIYKLYVVEHSGDTRGNDWYSQLVCLAVDQATNQVQLYAPTTTPPPSPAGG